MRRILSALAVSGAALAAAAGAQAQGNQIVIDGGSVRIQSDQSGGNSIVGGGQGAAAPGKAPSSGGNAQGVSIVNGTVFIDGDPVPPDAREFTGRSGQTYVIERQGTGVSVRNK